MESITRIVQYKVKKKKLDKVKNTISEYIEIVRKNEPGIIEYKVYQEDDDPASIVHIISFTDKNAEKIHDKSEHMKKLKKILVPMSKGKAVYVTLNNIQFIKSEEKPVGTDNTHSHEPI
ncbi:MAG: antibiotic biosynthesis monooxygenase [Thaumarchaeota archaeon]|nr:antibiotic biosynthesis monooxygenase [Nitrososphaerota archaeon]